MPGGGRGEAKHKVGRVGAESKLLDTGGTKEAEKAGITRVLSMKAEEKS